MCLAVLECDPPLSWVDPEEDLIGIFMIQIRPNRDVTFRRQFKRLVYQAVIGS